MTSLAPLLEAFFMERLLEQRRASPHTIASYRDSFRLLLNFAQERLGRAPSALLLTDLDAAFIGSFLAALEESRNNTVRTRNLRLVAIRSFFRYAALKEPSHSGMIQRVLAIPEKRCDRKTVTFLSEAETDALVDAPERTAWIGCRDHALLVLAVQTGLRVSELTNLTCDDIELDVSPHVRCVGKGRKERAVPLSKETVKVLRSWLRMRSGARRGRLFPSRRGDRLSRDAVERLVTKYSVIASQKCPSLREKKVSPHVLRHTTAVALLRAGVDHCVIALWLGHESADTTQIYLDADLSIKQRALDRTTPTGAAPGRFRPDDELLAFLKRL